MVANAIAPREASEQKRLNFEIEPIVVRTTTPVLIYAKNTFCPILHLLLFVEGWSTVEGP